VKKKTWIIIAAIVLVLGAAAFFLIRGGVFKSREAQEGTENDAPYECTYKDVGNDVKVTVTGDFSENSWIAQSQDEAVVTVNTDNNGKKLATFTMKAAQDGMTTVALEFSALEDENNGFQFLLDVRVSEGKVLVAALRQRMGNVQNFEGSTGEFDYICNVMHDTVEVILTTNKPVQWDYTIDKDSFLVIESFGINPDDEAAAESPAEATATQSQASTQETKLPENMGDEEFFQLVMEKLGYTEEQVEAMDEDTLFALLDENEEKVEELRDEGNKSEDETEETRQDGYQEMHFVFTADNYGEEQFVRLYSSSLTKALEITVKCTQEGVLSVEKLQPANYTAYSLGDDSQSRLDAYYLVGEAAFPTYYSAYDYRVFDLSTASGTASVASYTVNLDGAEWLWDCYITPDTVANDLMKTVFGTTTGQWTTDYNGTILTVCTSDSGKAVFWEKDGLSYLITRANTLLSTDESGESIYYTTSDDSAYYAATCLIGM